MPAEFVTIAIRRELTDAIDEYNTAQELGDAPGNYSRGTFVRQAVCEKLQALGIDPGRGFRVGGWRPGPSDGQVRVRK